MAIAFRLRLELEPGVLTSFIQYDTESQNSGTNTRLRSNYKPGNDLFVVWNRGWQNLF